MVVGSKTVVFDGEIEKSATDDRVYRAFTLSNEMKCLVVSDVKGDKASIALDVTVGNYWDKIPGEAHFLEHMLFMGTEKYPDENAYTEHLHNHGGYGNAYTASENTNFHCEIAIDQLESTMDRLSKFFICPLLKENTAERERQAVDSEFAMNKQSDSWRQYQLIKELVDPSHPYYLNGCGNVESLSVDGIHEKLWEFYRKNYSSNRMALVVLGRESVDTLQTWVETYFSDVPNQKLAKPNFPGNPFRNNTPKRFLVVPVKPQITLDLFFPLREVETLYRSKPLRYLSHLLGHESAGSVLAWLKHRQWAHELASSESESCSDWSAFGLQISLTELGFQNVNKVVEVVFAYLHMLRDMGPQKWVHEEVSTVSDCSFRFLSRRDPIDYTSSLAQSLHEYPPEWVLSGAYKFYDYQPDRITEILNAMTPQNMVMLVSNPAFEGKTKSTESWYGTQYTLEDIDSHLLEQWSGAKMDALHLPERNDMLATDFGLKEMPSVDRPALLRDSPLCRLWYKPDNVFHMPKANCLAACQTAVAYETPKATVLTTLWQFVVMEHANEFLYLASMAGLHGSVSAARNGFELSLSGYHHKMDRLMERMVETIRSVPDKLTRDVYDRLYDKLEKQYQQFLVTHPYRHAFYGADVLLMSTKWTTRQKMEALERVTMDDLVEFARVLIASFRLEMLVHGNVLPEQAQHMAQIVLDGLQPTIPAAMFADRRVVMVPHEDVVYRFDEFNRENTNSCTYNIFQVPSNAMAAFFGTIWEEPSYTTLRTQQQLGYVVWAFVHTAGDYVKGVSLLVQSDSHNPQYLNERMDAFVQSYYDEKLVPMTQEEFQTKVQGVVTHFREKNKNLGEESWRYWDAISKQHYVFDKSARIANEVETFTKEQVLEFYRTYFLGPKRRKISVQVVSHKHKDSIKPEEGVIDNIQEFKKKMPTYPLPQEVNVESMRIENNQQT